MKTAPLPITGKPIVTASVGKNAEQFRDILKLYVPEGSVIADVTFGHGWFWRLVDNSKYTVLASDLSDRIFNPQINAFDQFHRLQADMTRLPYRDGSLDAVVIDPPYAQGSTSPRLDCISRSYNLKTQANLHGTVQMYRGSANGIHRVLRLSGIVIVKCQDCINEGRQWWMHSLVRKEFEANGFELIDLFILVQEHTPIMRHKYQYHARKNHSYWLIMRKK